MFKTLIEPAELAAHVGDPKWVAVDCRFDLANPERGEQDYLDAHIPGAAYAHLDRDLSGTKTGTNGRHPLPTIDEMAARFGALGIAPGTQVVAYDQDSGMFAARLWWMLRFMGHEAVAVLNGGLAAWKRSGGALEAGPVSVSPATFESRPHPEWRLTVDQVAAGIDGVLVDARSPERFKGVGETLDKVGGHIPGARNYFFQQNLKDDKTFKPADELRSQWETVLKGTRPTDAVMYCGSGVTACHNLLSLEVAGLSGARIFPGSWSEWSADQSRPVET
jgi:thiosulfate/3-mercaptopyruvate sulfurtransferase